MMKSALIFQNNYLYLYIKIEEADMVELAVTPDLGSGGETRGSSSLSIRTIRH